MKKKMPFTLLGFVPKSKYFVVAVSVVKIQTHPWFSITYMAEYSILVSYLGYIIDNKGNNLELKCFEI